MVQINGGVVLETLADVEGNTFWEKLEGLEFPESELKNLGEQILRTLRTRLPLKEAAAVVLHDSLDLSPELIAVIYLPESAEQCEQLAWRGRFLLRKELRKVI